MINKEFLSFFFVYYKMFPNKQTGSNNLDPVIPSSELWMTKDDVFDLAYLEVGLNQARILAGTNGFKRNFNWDNVIQHLAKVNIAKGLYLRPFFTHLLNKQLQAERVGFEPTVQFNPYDDLANRSFRPLRHLS